MAQDQIFDFLVENKPKRFLAIQLMLNLNIQEQSLHNNLRRMRKRKEVEYKNHKYWVNP